MNRRERMIELKHKGFSYSRIGIIFSISRQRVHQIVTGYAVTNNLKEQILARDNFICQRCGSIKGIKQLIVHHIDRNPKHNEFGNLITLCSECHTHLHKR